MGLEYRCGFIHGQMQRIPDRKTDPIPEQDSHVSHELVVRGHEVPDVGVRVNQPLASTGTLLALSLHLNSRLLNIEIKYFQN